MVTDDEPTGKAHIRVPFLLGSRNQVEKIETEKAYENFMYLDHDEAI